jgi:hypothetical protein
MANSEADDDQPPRRERREGERDQPAGDDGAAVAEKESERLAEQAQHERFAEQAETVAMATCTSTTGPISQA